MAIFIALKRPGPPAREVLVNIDQILMVQPGRVADQQSCSAGSTSSPSKRTLRLCCVESRPVKPPRRSSDHANLKFLIGRRRAGTV